MVLFTVFGVSVLAITSVAARPAAGSIARHGLLTAHSIVPDNSDSNEIVKEQMPRLEANRNIERPLDFDKGHRIPSEVIDEMPSKQPQSTQDTKLEENKKRIEEIEALVEANKEPFGFLTNDEALRPLPLAPPMLDPSLNPEAFKKSLKRLMAPAFLKEVLGYVPDSPLTEDEIAKILAWFQGGVASSDETAA